MNTTPVDSHIPIIPTNLGDHSNFINKCRDPSGKIDPDAKKAINDPVDSLKFNQQKHKQTQEELESNKPQNTGFFSNMSLTIVIFVFLIILLILAIVWLVLKYNNLKQDADAKEKKFKEQVEEKNKEIEDIIESAKQNMHMLMCNAPQSKPYQKPPVLPVSVTNVEEVIEPTEHNKPKDFSSEISKPSQEELEKTLKKLDLDLETGKKNELDASTDFNTQD